MSTEQVAHGKRAPDIYLAVTAALGFPPAACAAVEDSSNGLRSAAAAGLRVIAVPQPRYPPDAGRPGPGQPGAAEPGRAEHGCRGGAGYRLAARAYFLKWTRPRAPQASDRGQP